MKLNEQLTKYQQFSQFCKNDLSFGEFGDYYDIFTKHILLIQKDIIQVI